MGKYEDQMLSDWGIQIVRSKIRENAKIGNGKTKEKQKC